MPCPFNELGQSMTKQTNTANDKATGHETELKFLIPENKVNAVKTQVNGKTAKQHVLKAYYFDIPNQLLAKAGIAIRIRYEDGIWVQTVKARADGLTTRLEENITLELPKQLNTDADNFVPDISKHSLAIQDLFAKILPIATLQTQLSQTFSTQVNRITRVCKRYGSIVEIAFDEGKIISGNQSVPICEIEFELLQGDLSFLINTSQAWVKKHQLYYSDISKAGCGNRLFMQTSKINTQPKKQKTIKAKHQPFTPSKKISQDAFVRLAVQNCLQHILPNISEIATASEVNPKHVHQARVGIRRLRTVLSVFADFSADIKPHWQTDIKTTFQLLGDFRDLDILKQQTQPMLEMQGAPVIDIPTQLTHTPAQAVQRTDFQLCLLELMLFASIMPDANADFKNSQSATFENNDNIKANVNSSANSHTSDDKPVSAKKATSVILDKLFDKIIKDSAVFATLTNEQQHDVRKRLKKLRYVSEFASPLYRDKHSNKQRSKHSDKHQDKQTKTSDKKPKKDTNATAFLTFLKPAQDLLGDFNDAHVGYHAYLKLTDIEPKAWFAVGWFGANEKTTALKCAESLKTVKFAPVFW